MDLSQLLFITLAVICLQFAFTKVVKKGIKKKCETCREVMKNFKKGLDKTNNKNFGGGDSAWEEKKLGTFARSETRLLEILENVCDGVDKESQCHAMIEQHEEDLENWWFKKFGTSEQLEQYLCIDTIEVCCPKGKFGKSCKECLGGYSSPCNGHGTCRGDGTRVGNGSCNCQDAYQGDACDSCSEGYSLQEDKSCLDINECSNGEAGCVDDEYCENTQGSFECHTCPDQCTTCNGPTMKQCTNCKDGYKLDPGEGGCIDIDECSEPYEQDRCSPEHVCANTNGSYACVKKGPEDFKYGDDGYFYRFHDTEATWIEARDSCKADGGWLASFETDTEIAYTKTEYGSKRMWIGANDRDEEGSWVWAREGSKIGSTQWEDDEPNGKENDNCAVTNWNSPGKWNDDACESKFPYLCQYTHPKEGEESTTEEEEGSHAKEHDASEL